MKARSFAAAAAAILLFSIAGLANHHTKAAKSQPSRLVTLLPASSAVTVFDSKRFLDDALPKLLSANQVTLGEIMAKLNEIENRTGIDLRKFDTVAVGIAFDQVSANKLDFEPVAIASGDINAGALIAVAKLASNGTYRTEKIGDRTVYIFSAPDVFQKTAAKATGSKIADFIDKSLNSLLKDVAVAAIDKNTLVLGSVARVRETLAGKTHVAADITGLLGTREGSVLNFAAQTPGTMSKLLPLDNDEFGKNVDSIKYIYGSVNVQATGASIQMTARTARPDQAQGLKDTLDGLQMLGKAVFGSSKRADQQVYGRMIKNAKFEQHGNEVNFDIYVPQSDIDILVAGIK